jgi:ADP-L-glycero-D-manno-heptose 6-epimerase
MGTPNAHGGAMHIVTGAAGFIGSNLVNALNERGIRDIIAVDDLGKEDKFLNLSDCDLADFIDRRQFRQLINRGAPGLEAKVVLHQGACANTMEADGDFMTDNNYTYSKELLHWCMGRKVPFVYASSASVYGASQRFVEAAEFESPLNVYAFSKLQFDRYVRRFLPHSNSSIVGLRYTNVYGPRERNKGCMASMVHQLAEQLSRSGVARLFEGTDGYADGEQRRDFVYVGDVIGVNVFFAKSGPHKGIFNVGSGQSRSFNDVARILIRQLGRGEIQYIPFPESLRGKYQSFTESDISQLRSAGYLKPFHSLEEGIKAFCESLQAKP